jgi:hypothetical protein
VAIGDYEFVSIVHCWRNARGYFNKGKQSDAPSSECINKSLQFTVWVARVADEATETAKLLSIDVQASASRKRKHIPTTRPVLICTLNHLANVLHNKSVRLDVLCGCGRNSAQLPATRIPCVSKLQGIQRNTAVPVGRHRCGELLVATL